VICGLFVIYDDAPQRGEVILEEVLSCVAINLFRNGPFKKSDTIFGCVLCWKTILRLILKT